MGLDWLQLLFVCSGNISNDQEEAINCFETLYDPLPILRHPGDELCALEVSFSLPLPHPLPSSWDLTDVITFVLFIVHSGNKIPLS